METTVAHRQHAIDLMDHTTDLVIVVARDLTVQAVSASLGRILGPDGGRPGSGLDELLHPDDRTTFERIVGGPAGVPPGNGPFRILDADGAWRRLTAVARTWQEEGDQCLVICREDPDPTRLPSLLRRATEAANETSDLDAVLRLVAADIGQTLGWSASAVVHNDDSAGPSATLDAILATADATALREEVIASRRSECVMRTSTDREWTYIAVPVVADARTAAVLLFATNARVASTGLRDVLGSISWQLGMVAARQADRRALERRDAELERSNAELERFAYVASHDLQEPLRKVVTACDLLQERSGSELAASGGGKYVEIAVDAARRMQTLISDLLGFSRIGRGEARDGEVDLQELVSDVCASFSQRIEEAQSVVDVGALPIVRAGSHEMQQLFSNVLSNALKFRSVESPRVTITARTEAGEVHVTVADNGIGIAPEYQERIFEVFRRLHRQDEYEGTGIGLAVAKRIVEHHGGRMWVTSAPDGGSKFHFTLPEVPS